MRDLFVSLMDWRAIDKAQIKITSREVFSGDKKWLGLVQPPGVCVGWLQLTGLKTDMRVLGVPPTLLGEPPLNSHLLPSYQLN